MKVKELIKELQRHDLDLEVTIEIEDIRFPLDNVESTTTNAEGNRTTPRHIVLGSNEDEDSFE